MVQIKFQTQQRPIMRAIMIAVALSLSVIAPARAAETCKTPGTPSKNIALVKGFYDALNTRSKQRLDNVLATDWLDVPLSPGQGAGPRWHERGG